MGNEEEYKLKFTTEAELAELDKLAGRVDELKKKAADAQANVAKLESDFGAAKNDFFAAQGDPSKSKSDVDAARAKAQGIKDELKQARIEAESYEKRLDAANNNLKRGKKLVKETVEQREKEAAAAKKLAELEAEHLESTKELKEELKEVTELKEKAAAAAEKEAGAQGNEGGGKGRFAWLKKVGGRVKSLTIKGAKLLGVFGAVVTVFTKLGQAMSNTGKKMQSLGDDLELVGSKGEAAFGKLISKGGEWLEKAGNFLNFYGRYQQAVAYAAEQQRKLDKLEAEQQRRFDTAPRRLRKATEQLRKITAASDAYAASTQRRTAAEKEYQEALAASQKTLSLEQRKLAAVKEASLTELAEEEEDKLAAVDLENISDEEKQAKRARIKIDFAKVRRDLEQDFHQREQNAKLNHVDDLNDQLTKKSAEKAALDADSGKILTSQEVAANLQRVEDLKPSIKAAADELLTFQQTYFRLTRQEGLKPEDRANYLASTQKIIDQKVAVLTKLTDQDQALKKEIKESAAIAKKHGFDSGDAFRGGEKKLERDIEATKNLKNTVIEDIAFENFRNDTRKQSDKRADGLSKQATDRRIGLANAGENLREGTAAALPLVDAAVKEAGNNKRLPEGDALVGIRRQLEDGTNAEELKAIQQELNTNLGAYNSEIVTALRSVVQQLLIEATKAEALKDELKSVQTRLQRSGR